MREELQEWHLFISMRSELQQLRHLIHPEATDARKNYGGVHELQEDYRRALEKMPA